MGLDPRKTSAISSSIDDIIELISKNIIKDQKSIPVQKILDIKKQIHEDLYNFEFNMFEPVDNKITGE